MHAPLIGITTRRLVTGRVKGWRGPGYGELAAYADAVVRAGGQPVLLVAPPDPHDGAVAELAERLDGLVLTGGPDLDPARYGEAAHERVYGVDELADAFELALARHVAAHDLPTLAICRGLQVLNVALGGTLHQHLGDLEHLEPDAHGTPGVGGGGVLHPVDVEPGSVLANVVGARLEASSHHHQAVAATGAGVHVVGRAPDGVVEAIAVDGAPRLLAVQWHPEDTAAHDAANHALFEALIVWSRSGSQR